MGIHHNFTNATALVQSKHKVNKTLINTNAMYLGITYISKTTINLTNSNFRRNKEVFLQNITYYCCK